MSKVIEVTELEASESKIEIHCAWIANQLRDRGVATKAEFENQFRHEAKKNLGPDWSNAKYATIGVFNAQGVKLDNAKTDEIRLSGPFPRSMHSSPRFRPDEDYSSKQRIGRLVAGFLKDKKIAVFLGSGSTVYHVGIAMCELGPYDQLLWTVNIPLASHWCEVKNPPVAGISIPEAVLETKTYRFATMKPPGWASAMVIVGVDGIRYDRKGEVYLYGNEQSTADNTNLFVENATHSVIYCLTSRKVHFGPFSNSGPRINPPSKGILRVLVTDKPLSRDVGDAFRKDDWIIVAEENDWKQVETILADAGSPEQQKKRRLTAGGSEVSVHDHKSPSV